MCHGRFGHISDYSLIAPPRATRDIQRARTHLAGTRQSTGPFEHRCHETPAACGFQAGGLSWPFAVPGSQVSSADAARP
jgi:hypothetical protein